MNKLNEMWAALAAYQPKADAEGHGETWATMCRERTSEAADTAAVAAWSAASAETAYVAAGDAADAAADACVAYAEADWSAQKVIGRINKLNEAQPKQEQGEPVAWNLKDVTDAYKLGAKSQQRKPLTDEEIRAVSHETVSNVTTSEAVMFRAFARAIEAAHGIGVRQA
jgi:hypothetical protein